MSANSKIQWTDDTHNFWRGCTKVSPGCKNCYAEALVTTRLGGKWGPGAPRDILTDFNAPLRWNKKPWVCNNSCGFCCAEPEGLLDTAHDCFHSVGFHRRRVFSLSLGDIFDPEVDIEWFARALDVIRRCDQLTWQLVTKRPELFFARLRAALRWTGDHYSETDSEQTLFIANWLDGIAPKNIWIIASAEDQPTLDARLPHLLKIPARIHGLSCEPLLGPLTFPNSALRTPHSALNWVIVGGESGPHARPCNIDWIGSIVAQCKAAAVPCFVKQLGSNLSDLGLAHCAIKSNRSMAHKKGGDMSEWPDDLRIRQFPEL